MEAEIAKRKREKAAEKAKLAKVRAQIQKDKESRAAEAAAAKAGTSPTAVAAVAAPAPATTAATRPPPTECRVQIRPPAGAAMKATFPVEDTLESLFSFVDANRTDSSVAPYNLMMMRPHLVLTRGDGGKTFHEAGLVPSAALTLKYV